MRNFKTLILVLALAVASFAATGRNLIMGVAPVAGDPFVGYDRPFHFGKSDTGLLIGTNDSIFLVSNSNRSPLKTSDFNKSMALYNQAGGIYGYGAARKDSIFCDLSIQRVDADTSDIAYTVHSLDHGTTYATVGSGNIPTNVALTRSRITWASSLSNQYYVRLIMTTATDTARVYRASCGDK